MPVHKRRIKLKIWGIWRHGIVENDVDWNRSGHDTSSLKLSSMWYFCAQIYFLSSRNNFISKCRRKTVWSEDLAVRLNFIYRAYITLRGRTRGLHTGTRHYDPWGHSIFIQHRVNGLTYNYNSFMSYISFLGTFVRRFSETLIIGLHIL